MSYYQQEAQSREQYEKMSAAIQAACPQGVATESTIEELMQTTSGNLGEAESLAYQINDRLFGPTPTSAPCDKIGAPCLRSHAADFAKRTFDLSNQLRSILGRISQGPANQYGQYVGGLGGGQLGGSLGGLK